MKLLSCKPTQRNTRIYPVCVPEKPRKLTKIQRKQHAAAIKIQSVSRGKHARKECPICLEILASKKAIKLVCNHTFHMECIETWVKTHWMSSCPVCRSDLNTTQPKKVYVSPITFYQYYDLT